MWRLVLICLIVCLLTFEVRGHFTFKRSAKRNDRFSRSALNGFLMYTGTKWCGPGNIASGYDDLGTLRGVDSCCRSHDHCARYIPASSQKYGVDNTSPYTMSECKCDDEFRQCLHVINSKDSNEVGKLFFDALRTHCFKCEEQGECESAEKLANKPYEATNKPYQV